MGDFDTVLERLLSDPVFARALAADPAGALAGYRLSAEETEVLTTQVAEEPAGHAAVETRTSQSSLSGLFAPIGSAGFGEAPAADQGIGAAPTGESGFGGRPGFGEGAGAAGMSGAGAGIHGPGTYVAGIGTAGDVAGSGMTGTGTGTVHLGAASEAMSGLSDKGGPALPDGYQTHVDVDGDGAWDANTLRARADGGIDIEVDADSDGRVDFVGHDVDGDGLVDRAEYDTTGDGVFDTRMRDVDGDGWMDRTEAIP